MIIISQPAPDIKTYFKGFLLFPGQIRAASLPCRVLAVGTNSVATANMLKAGADAGATGENPVLTACRKADVIVGPVGIVIADSMLGEITPKMAEAIAQSSAKRILIPYNHCGNIIVGISGMSMSALIRLTVEEIMRDAAS